MKFKKGGYSGDHEFEIHKNFELREVKGLAPDYKSKIELFKKECCKHAHSFKTEKRSSYEVNTAIVPYMIVAYNEEEDVSTGVCAECVAEGLEKMKKQLKREKK